MEPINLAECADLVAAAIAPWHPKRVLVGYSGGLDSHVLLVAAATAVSNGQRDGSEALVGGAGAISGPAVLALHADHGIAKDSAAWRAHCEQQVGALGVTCIARRVAVAADGNLEASARRARYEFFGSQLRAGDVLLLAHHADDQAETILLRLLQGRGSSSMPASRAIGAATLVRPFLGLQRSNLVALAASLKLDWLEDPGNQDNTFDRNFLRSTVMPLLRERWPDAATRISDAAQKQVLRQTAVRAHAFPPLSPLVLRAAPANAPELARMLKSLSARTQLLRAWLESQAVALQGVTDRHLGGFLERAGLANPPPEGLSGDRNASLRLPGGTLRRSGEAVYFLPAVELPPATAVPAPGQLLLPHGELRVVVADPARSEAARAQSSARLADQPFCLRGFGVLPVDGKLTVAFFGRDSARDSGQDRTAHADSEQERTPAALPGRRDITERFRRAGVPHWLRPFWPVVSSGQRLLSIPGIYDAAPAAAARVRQQDNAHQHDPREELTVEIAPWVCSFVPSGHWTALFAAVLRGSD